MPLPHWRTLGRRLQGERIAPLAANALGRDPRSLCATGFRLGCVLDEGEPADSARARAEAGPQRVCALHSFVQARERGS